MSILICITSWIYIYCSKLSIDRLFSNNDSNGSRDRLVLLIVIIGNIIGAIFGSTLLLGNVFRIVRIPYAFFLVNGNTLGVNYIGMKSCYLKSVVIRGVGASIDNINNLQTTFPKDIKNTNINAHNMVESAEYTQSTHSAQELSRV